MRYKARHPAEFPDRALEEAKDAVELGRREDLTHIPIVAIHPADARDHDDALWAARDEDPANEGGWKAIVAIADVSFYVRPGSAIDKEARKRGNSVYFPDRVVPMLPESLSAEICSLKQSEDRAALVCHLQVSKDGQLRSWRFSRARVRIAANSAYEDARARSTAPHGRATRARLIPLRDPEIEPSPPAVPPHLVESALRPLWDCWRALYAARAKRVPLELDLPERRVELDEKGRILSVAPRERLDAHKLIEDYMIAANVAAAKALESKKAPVMYRDHERRPRKLSPQGLSKPRVEAASSIGPARHPSTGHRADPSRFQPHVMEQGAAHPQGLLSALNHGLSPRAGSTPIHQPVRRYADLVSLALWSSHTVSTRVRRTAHPFGAGDGVTVESSRRRGRRDGGQRIERPICRRHLSERSRLVEAGQRVQPSASSPPSKAGGEASSRSSPWAAIVRYDEQQPWSRR